MHSEKIPVFRPSNTCVVQSFVRVYSWDGEPLADVDMSTGEQLSVQWPCRLEFISMGGMPPPPDVSWVEFSRTGA